MNGSRSANSGSGYTVLSTRLVVIKSFFLFRAALFTGMKHNWRWYTAHSTRSRMANLSLCVCWHARHDVVEKSWHFNFEFLWGYDFANTQNPLQIPAAAACWWWWCAYVFIIRHTQAHVLSHSAQRCCMYVGSDGTHQTGHDGLKVLLN